MSKSRGVVLIALALSVMVLGGCGRKVKLMIDNQSDKTFAVSVEQTGRPVLALGTIGPGGQRLRIVRTLKFKKKNLPSQVIVKVGPRQHSFKVTRDEPKMVRLYVSIVDGRLLERGEGPVTEKKIIDVTEPVGEPTEVIE